MIDLHLHTEISYDSEEDAENYVQAAISRGESVLGFSDHYDYDVALEQPDFVLPSPENSFAVAKSLNAKYPQVKILKGIELGYCADALPHYRELLGAYPFDYAICSVHTLKGRGDCWFKEFFQGLERREAYEKYYQAVLESVRSDLDFQIVAHIGYVARNAPYADRKIIYTEFSCVIDQILKEIIARGASLEINTSVGSSGARFVPDTDVLERYFELGGENLTFGSDAHAVKNYLRGAQEVKEFLLSLGVKQMCYYQNAKLKRYPL